MFSEELKKQLENLGVNPKESATQIRYALEDALDEASEFVNTEQNQKYLVAERVYSAFMEEYNKILDAGDALFD